MLAARRQRRSASNDLMLPRETESMAERDTDCIFCKIAAGELGTSMVVETDRVVAFDDIAPQAPVHILVVPKRHLESVRDLGADDGLWYEIIEVANRAAGARGVAASGFRLVTNAGPDSGQEVAHLHVHVLGGRKLGRLA
jgi:histidine triad (HIT) family protein